MGDTILGNRYEIIRKIGDGGMAFVYEAKDRLLNRTVALKVLRPEFVDDDEFLTKFKREAEAVASLSHPNIVNVYDVGEDGKVHYIVMEFVDGKNLKEIIQDEGILDEYTALDITKQIAMALSAAHKKGIIHRDIKPHNILISNEGRVVKVADFGIAKAVSNSTMTNIGSIIGSVHYFSPEQAKGKFVTNNADLYSLGIVLYEMLIGKVPFRGDSPISIALQHINDDIDFTSEEKVRIPQSVRTTIKKLTEKSSADRYQTAEELIEDIDYIEKNIDLDFIKEYDDFATKKIDEKEINKAVTPILAKPVPEKVVKPIEVADLDEDEDYYDDFYEEDDDEEDEDEEEIMRAKKNQKPKNTQSKRAKKKKKKQESPKARKRLKVVAAVLIVILCAQVFLAYKFLFAGGFGSKDLTVPNLVNMTLEEAQSAVEKEGLSLSVKSEEYSSEVDKNCIISQTPEGGSTNIKKGDTINVVVSKGASEASVPNVVGITLTNAKKIIEENKLKVGTVKYEYSSVYKEGTVLSQSPSSGSSSVQEGDEIDLYVSKGPEKSNTPTPTTPNKTPTTPDEDDTTTPGSNSGNSGGNSGGSNSGNSGGNSGGSNSGTNGGNSGNSGGNSGNSGDGSGNSGGNSGNNGDNSGDSNSGNSGDNSGGSNSGNTGETPSGTGGNIGKSE
ncbi:Stk1 family PASTA domain-containing Ser/Thr kinase [Clostridioides sp. ZZV15-6598]|uniref:Stk1 family PASTA domain-containing Ser/Thr kinase n=1 Tax=Clostridioides sp. ZZV15-6598 TaxID=2811501 RepID=UPI001D11D953|nr:Stk1 family PASTA domain-containing Ser/Thr kinase [Clostridioides sp. ZZV15-6598]